MLRSKGAAIPEEEEEEDFLSSDGGRCPPTTAHRQSQLAHYNGRHAVTSRSRDVCYHQ